MLTPAALERGIQPLAHPLDELLVLHRTVRAGGLVLQGSVVRRGDRALVFLGGQRPAGGSPESRTSWRPVRSRHLRGQRIVVRPSIEGIRVLALPTCSPDPLPAGRSARLDAIHAIRPSRAVFADRLGPDDAICELLESTFAPIHDPLCADRSFGAAADIIDRVPVVRLGLPDQEQVVPFTWGRAGAALAFAPPFVV